MSIKRIQELLEQQFIDDVSLEWVDVGVNSYNLVNITVVSNKFEELSYEDRLQLVREVANISLPLEEGFIDTYTVSESIVDGMQRPEPSRSTRPLTWQDLAFDMKASKNIKPDNIGVNRPRIVSFYSFKGGVGRTTALVHAAYSLASRGKKVVVVDFDLEAPGMTTIFDPKYYAKPRYGLVDYLYERVTTVDDLEKHVSITDIFSEINFSELPGRLFLVQAGELNHKYLEKVDSFRAANIVNVSKNYWDEFVDELTRQIAPDIILVDSRTGLNGWGALSILHLSDKVLFFAYPNSENMDGLKLVIGSMKKIGYTNYHVIFSRIHDDKVGKRKVDELWEQVKFELYDEVFDESTGEILPEPQPLRIFYNSELAVADYFPTHNGVHVFSQVANLLDEDIEDDDLIHILAGADRWDIIKSLPFENLGFSETEDDPSLFQKTVYVDKFLDKDVPVITGKKGTGKTKMYSMMLRHLDQVKAMSRILIDDVVPLSGHGDFAVRPIDEFDTWAKLVESSKCSWEHIWRSYLLITLQKNNVVSNIKNAKYKALKEFLKSVRKDIFGWKVEYTNVISTITTDMVLAPLIQDYLTEIDTLLQKKGQQLWIHYDKLDEDLEKKPYGKQAIGGLFKLVQIFEGRHIKNIKFKIFIRQDIWDDLSFTNKSHFNGRTIKLEWNQQDFLKLALKISLKSGEFTDLIDRYRPSSQSVDYMDLNALKESLQLLWGIRRDSSRSQYVVNWIYERLTDADDNTFPRSLFMLLKGAKEQELTYEHSTSIQPPRDRLLRTASLNAGLKEASLERCDALKQEYESLNEVFDLFSSFTDIFTYEEFLKVYKNTGWKPKELLDTLRKIGVVSEREKDAYKFAHIYLDGFKIKRTSKT